MLLSGDAALVTDFGIAKAIALSKTEAPRGTLTQVGLDGGTLMARDSLNGRLLAVHIDRSEALPRELARDLTDENKPIGNGVISTDRRTFLVRNRRGIWVLPVSGGALRQVLRFDDPLHPHALNGPNFAMHAGRLYFTLQDPQSNVWVAPVTGLAK